MIVKIEFDGRRVEVFEFRTKEEADAFLQGLRVGYRAESFEVIIE